MLTESGLRIVFGLLTIVLLGMTAMGMSFAEEAGHLSTLPADASVPQPSHVNSSGEGAAKVDGQPQAHSKGGETETPSGEGAPKETGGALHGPGVSDPNDIGNDVIDTRIGMPHRIDGRRNKVENVKARVKLLAPRRPSITGTFDRSMRNAIGAPLAPHGGEERRDSEHHAIPSIVPNSSVPGVAGGAKAEGHVERPTGLQTGLSAGMSPGTLNRGMISGTSATRLSAGQHSIGGPAKAVAGISGSTVRSKH